MSSIRQLRRAVRRARRTARHRQERRRERGRRTLGALGASALALPGLAGFAAGPAGASAPIDRWNADYGFSLYREDDIPGSLTSTGQASERFSVQSHQFLLEGPLTERSDWGLDLMHESMSGATPWFVEPGPGGEPLQVMSGATVEDRRTDILLRGNYHYDTGRTGLTGGVSWENDYLAINAGLGGERHFNDENTTLGGGLGLSFDRITPTGGGSPQFPTRPEEERKRSYSLNGALTQILTRNTIAQTGLTYQFQNGYLSDPYKLVSVAGSNLADSRPPRRHQLSWLTRLRQHVPRVDGSLHFDYRLYWDSWAVTSHTFELAWYQTLFERFQLVPAVRYYSQSGADFYAPYFSQLPSDGFASSDYRLSPYGALSYSVRGEAGFVGWPFDLDWRLVLSYERYQSGAGLALGNVVVANPGLVDFHVFSAGLTGSF